MFVSILHYSSIIFQTYKDFFDSILKEIHNFGPEDKHPAPDLDGSKVHFIKRNLTFGISRCNAKKARKMQFDVYISHTLHPFCGPRPVARGLETVSAHFSCNAYHEIVRCSHFD